MFFDILEFFIITACVGVLYLIGCLISIPVVKKRILWGKNMLIGRDSPEKIEEMKNLAKKIYETPVITVNDEKEDYVFLIGYKNGKVDSVKISSERTTIIYRKNDSEPFTIENKAFTDKSAIFFAGLIPFTVLFLAAFAYGCIQMINSFSL